VQDQVAPVARRGDVEEGQLVGALLVVARGDLDRVARVAKLDEVDALDDAAAVTSRQGMMRLASMGRRRRSGRPRQALAELVGAAPAPRRNRGRRCRSRGRRSRPRCRRPAPRRALDVGHRREPPEANTGIVSCCASFTVASMLTPVSMPSRPMSV
jgi:hypothetical protein